MGLSVDLISQFAKITNDKSKQPKETVMYGTAVKYGGTTYVKLDGSDMLTPVNTTVDVVGTVNPDGTIQDGERVTVTIRNHVATATGNTSSPAARIDTVRDVDAKVDAQGNIINIQNSRINTVESDINIVKSEVNTQNSKINTVESDISTFKSQVNTQNSKIETLDYNISKINSDIEIYNSSFKIDNGVVTGLKGIDTEWITVEDLEANNAKIENLEADYTEINKLVADKADIEDLNATNATIENLKANDLKAISADIVNLEADVADIDTLIFGSASGTTIHTSFSNAVIAQVGEAQIKSAMIESIAASKIMSGDIYTNNVHVLSEDGKLTIADETLQIKDENNTVRVQIGKDASDDYSINVWDANGKLMFSEGGITDDAIKQAIIRNDMVSDTANISASKLNIASLFTEINQNGTETIKSNKIYLDDEAQTLNVAFTQMTTDVEDLSETVESQGTALSVVQGKIDSKVWQQDIDTATNTMNTKYSELEQTVNGVKSTVADVQTNMDLHSDVTNYAQLNDDTASKWGFTADATADGHWYTMDVLSRDKFISDWHQCNGAERFRIYFEISTSFMGNSSNGGTDSVYRGTALGLYGYDANGTSVGISYSDRVMASAEATPTVVSCVASVSSKARKFRVFLQTETYGNFSGSVKVRNVRVEKIDKTLETIVVSNRSMIEQHADSINAAVERISNNETDIASLQITADGISSRVTSTEKNINELEIGGRNLFENSAALSTDAIKHYFAPEAPPYTITVDIDPTVPSGNCVICGIREITTPLTNGGFYLDGPFGNYIPKMVTGETYTVSVWMKCSRNINYGAISPEFLSNRVRQDSNNISTEWQKFIVTGTYNGNTTSSIAITFYYNSLIQSNDRFYISSPQIEKGNKATDWSPAHEDMATTDDIDAVDTTIDSMKEDIVNSETLIKQLSDSISTLVVDSNGESLMTQTSTGWVFSTTDIQDKVNSTSEKLGELTEQVGGVDVAVDALEQAVNDLGVLNEYVKITTYEDEPCIELGETDSDFKLLITNTRIMFYEGSGVPAYINNQSLYINKAVIEAELQQGEFIWQARSNGNLGLIWKGATS